MSNSAPPTPITGSFGDAEVTVPIPVARLQQLEAFEARAELDMQSTQLLQKRVDEVEAALHLEQARSEKHADALMQIARTCDSRVQELETQHAAVLASKDAVITKLEGVIADVKAAAVELKAGHTAAIAVQDTIITDLRAGHAAAIAVQETIISELKAEVGTLKAQAASKLTDIHAAVAALQTLEIYPIHRADSRQFAAWHCGPVPPLPVKFDRAWAAALSRSTKHSVEVDAATGARVSVASRTGKSECVELTLRSAAPLPQSLGSPSESPLQQQGSLPAYRVVVEAYGETKFCDLGFIPSHLTGPDGTAIGDPLAPSRGARIMQYGGWYIQVAPSRTFVSVSPSTRTGWVALPPAASVGDDGTMAAAVGGEARGQCSAYATTDKVPPVPPGSAVEFAVDYARGTCRVAFYSPAAVASGFMELPYAKMELRFVASEADVQLNIPARPVPAAADSQAELYPAVSPHGTDATLRFVA